MQIGDQVGHLFGAEDLPEGRWDEERRWALRMGLTGADSIEDKVKDIIVEQLGVNADQVSPEAKFIEDLGADSLDTVELVMALEEEFGQEIPDDEAEKLQSVGDVIKYIEETQGE